MNVLNLEALPICSPRDSSEINASVPRRGDAVGLSTAVAGGWPQERRLLRRADRTEVDRDRHERLIDSDSIGGPLETSVDLELVHVALSDHYIH